MRIYRVVYSTVDMGSGGFTWHSNRREAAAEAAKFRRENADDGYAEARIEPVEFAPTLRGILRILRIYATHNDNG